MTSVGDHARLAQALHAVDTAMAAAVIAAAASTDHLPGTRIRAARRLRAQSLAVVDAAVVIELLEGATMEQVAHALGSTIEHANELYGPIVARWLGAHDESQDDAVARATDLTATYRDLRDPEAAYARLRAWLDTHYAAEHAPTR